MNLDEQKLLLFILGILLMLGIEFFFSYRTKKQSKQKRILVHGSLALLNSVILKLTLSAPLIWWIVYCQEKELGIIHYIKPNFSLIGLAFLTVIVFDFFIYWWHRWNHTVPFLWKFHQVHHTDIEMDITTSLRFHPIEFLFSHTLKAIWVIIWGPSVMDFLVFEITVTAANQFHHSNFRLHPKLDQFLRYFIVTPQFHTAHHTIDKATSDAHYGTILSLWDRIFGSYIHPETVSQSQDLGTEKFREDGLNLKKILLQPFR